MPKRRDWRIGCLGAGFIMRDCHLPAYFAAGFSPHSIASLGAKSAMEVYFERFPGRFGGTCHILPSDLLNDPEIEILDIAVPPDQQTQIILEAVECMKNLRGILAQKPLAMNLADARKCVDACDRRGVKLAVNQNMRYDQSVRAMKDLLDKGWIGEPVLATIEMRAIPHWMPWAQMLPSLATFVMSIHHLDTFRHWFGTPDRVLASTRPDPRTKFEHDDGINLYILEYGSGMRCVGIDDVWTGPAREGSASDIGIKWRVEGTDGLATGTIGWPGYPERVPSTIDFTAKRFGPVWHKPRWNEVWFPDAFAGTMAQLMVAIEEDAEPAISGRDNLDTIRLCEAVLRGAREHAVMELGDFP